MRNDRDLLMKALEFHGYRCWASVAGVRAGPAALRVLDVKPVRGMLAEHMTDRPLVTTRLLANDWRYRRRRANARANKESG